MLNIIISQGNYNMQHTVEPGLYPAASRTNPDKIIIRTKVLHNLWGQPIQIAHTEASYLNLDRAGIVHILRQKPKGVFKYRQGRGAGRGRSGPCWRDLSKNIGFSGQIWCLLARFSVQPELSVYISKFVVGIITKTSFCSFLIMILDGERSKSHPGVLNVDREEEVHSRKWAKFCWPHPGQSVVWTLQNDTIAT